MLGDTAEKPKNPLKKAMRRRNAKTVTFNPPTYYEANEPDWSDVEAENENGVSDVRVAPAQTSRNIVSTIDSASNIGQDGMLGTNITEEKPGISGTGEQYYCGRLSTIVDFKQMRLPYARKMSSSNTLTRS